jgi:hypothetical protein
MCRRGRDGARGENDPHVAHVEAERPGVLEHRVGVVADPVSMRTCPSGEVIRKDDRSIVPT